MNYERVVDDWYKVYFVRFIHINTDRIFYKFGITQKENILDRFNDRNDIRWKAFNKSLIDWFPVKGLERAEAFEKYLHSLFPKNIWLEKYLGEGIWDNFGGITELVALHHQKHENDIIVGRLKVSSFRVAVAEFEKLKVLAAKGEDPPPIIPYVRCNKYNALTVEAIQNAIETSRKIHLGDVPKRGYSLLSRGSNKFEAP